MSKKVYCKFCKKGNIKENQQVRDLDNNIYCITCYDLITTHLHKGIFKGNEAEEYEKLRNERIKKMELLILILKKTCVNNFFNGKETMTFIKEQIEAENNYSIEHYKKTRNCLKEKEYLEMTNYFLKDLEILEDSTHNFQLHKEVYDLYTKELQFV